MGLAPSEASAQIPCSYEVAAVIQAPPGPFSASPTHATGISPNGQYVVGYYNYDSVGGARPWFWSAGTGFIALPMPPGFYEATPADINNSQVMCGTGWHETLSQRGYIYDRVSGEFTILEPLPGGVYSGANGINEGGIVCGFRSIGPGVNPQTAFIWNPAKGGTFTDLGTVNGASTDARAINENGVTTGTMKQSNVTIPFIWDGQTLIPGPTLAGMQTIPRDINNSNVVVGQSLVPNAAPPPTNVNRGIRWDQATGSVTEIGVLPGHTISVASAVTDGGHVAGFCRLATTGGDHAYIWHSGTMVDVNTLLPQGTGIIMRTAGGGLTEAMRLVGRGSLDGDSVAVVLDPVWQDGDTNTDCTVDVDDLINVILSWGPCPGCSADVSHDGSVNIDDLIMVILNWG